MAATATLPHEQDLRYDGESDTLPARQHSASAKDQLAVWHANRGTKPFWRCMIPSVRQPVGGEEPETKNPFKIIRTVSGFGWLMFFSGWLAWTVDGYDFFCVSLTLQELAKQFDVSSKSITTAITLTLLFRSLGAVIIGLCADRFGRKWTLVCNCLLIMVFELGSGFVNTYKQFLAVRSLFGIAMGGIWGTAASTGLENIPPIARGLCSGILQQGYACGYLLAAVINLTVVQHSRYHWRAIYFFGAGFSLLAAIIRACLPESELYILARAEAKAKGISSNQATKNFIRELGNMFRTNWLRWIWGVCLMTFFNFFSHGSQDLYPTYLKVTKGFTSRQASIATIISNCGAITGGTIAGYASQYIGRRFAILICCAWTAAWIPLWILPSNFGGLSAGGFFIQSGVQGAWGIVPVYLSEVAPPAFRALYGGLVYQLGNMASAGSAQIEADAGESLKLKGTNIPDYAAINGILIGAVIAFGIVVVICGPEADGSHFESAKVAYEKGGGEVDPTQLIEVHQRHEKPELEHVETIEKAGHQHKEIV
ncbi:hypothetical protein L204_104287 [Cryptococcus depauperatus]|nr:MFS transporter, SHS family, lactate transporter [Cryptococcus depauperatus CBS 7855]